MNVIMINNLIAELFGTVNIVEWSEVIQLLDKVHSSEYGL